MRCCCIVCVFGKHPVGSYKVRMSRERFHFNITETMYSCYAPLAFWENSQVHVCVCVCV